ncbi:hypothetical protein [uncultured Actinomyces sp.]|uniref:hypothetical protein n=1 Tax=uncultured Actinomyces sp. TaxID=249061 RepID=UPI0026246AFA|nr:hypothetical protein [uncultured Actinomyces sp.]
MPRQRRRSCPVSAPTSSGPSASGASRSSTSAAHSMCAEECQSSSTRGRRLSVSGLALVAVDDDPALAHGTGVPIVRSSARAQPGAQEARQSGRCSTGLLMKGPR